MTTDPRHARKKILSIDEIAKEVEEAKKAGETVVLAHGVFDLLHLGHVRHLELARKEGTKLVVTITADKYVNKGPGRPVFTEQLRAEMLGALEYVDWVGVNHAPTAETVLEAIKPSVYVKGSDYKKSEDDVTGKIVNERQVVESHGGRVVFTDDVTFSSSALINQHLNVYTPTLQNYLDRMKSSDALSRVTDILESIKDYRVLVIGDAIIDEYQYVTPMGKSAKSNMIATLFKDKEQFAGGVFATANHAAGFCKKVDIITCLGEEDSFERLIMKSLKPNVGLDVIYRPEAPTTHKIRSVDNYSMNKLYEMYRMDDRPLGSVQKEQLMELIDSRIADYDVVVVNDFGHGLLDNDIVDLIVKKAPFLAVNAQSNSANMGFNLITRYKKADYVCIDSPEARYATQDKFSKIEVIITEKLAKVIDCPFFVVTKGKHGCVTTARDGNLHQIPALTTTIVDTVGAGDAFFAITSPMVASGAAMADIGFLGNAVGAIKVGVVGHRESVEKVPLVKFITALLK